MVEKNNSEKTLSKYQETNQETMTQEIEAQDVVMEEEELGLSEEIDDDDDDEYTRVSDYDRGDSMKPKWLEDNEHIYGTLESSFPLRAETVWRKGGGKTQFHNKKQAMEVMFDPKYGRCPAPIKDSRGEWNKRCKYYIPEKPSKEDLENYNNPVNREGVFESLGIKQWMARMHMKMQHFGWWLEEFGGVEEDDDGKEHAKPPENDTVIFPEWKAKIKKR